MGITEYLNDERIKTDREGFRALAIEALRRFSPDDREMAASLETEHVKTSDVLKVWAEQIAPVFSDLNERQSDTRFKKSLMRTIGFSEHEAETAIASMVEQRRQSLIDEVLGNLYHGDLHDVTYQQAYAETFFQQSEASIDSFMHRYGDFISAIDIAEKHHIVLLDAHSSWLERQRAALAIHKERQRITSDEDTRLEEIEAELQHLTRGTDRLLGQIVEKQWDFATILELQSKYATKIQSQKSADKRKPSVRYRLFEQVTADFRSDEANRLTRGKTHSDVQQYRQVYEEISSLLLEVFELKAVERTRLLKHIEAYSRLVRERSLILSVQRDREQFLAVHG